MLNIVLTRIKMIKTATTIIIKSKHWNGKGKDTKSYSIGLSYYSHSKPNGQRQIKTVMLHVEHISKSMLNGVILYY